MAVKIGFYGVDPLGIGMQFNEACWPRRATADDLYGELPERAKLCPGIADFLKNTYCVSVPFNLRITITNRDDGSYTWKMDEEFTTLDFKSRVAAENWFRVDDNVVVQFSVIPFWCFVSDTKNVVLMQHSHGLPGQAAIAGLFDIYKWPGRPVNLAFPYKSGVPIEITKNTPLYYVTFVTPDCEPTRLTYMREVPDFLQRSQHKDMMTIAKANNWKRIFNHFGRIRPRKLIP